MKLMKSSLKYLALFLGVTVLLTGLLTGVAMIPRSAIEENILKSAEFLCEGELFGQVVEGINGSKIDRYADSILLGIAYQYDNEKPLTSVMWSSYYHTNYKNVNDNLLEAVTKDLGPNQQYLRYWHGSNVLVRPLLMFFSIEHIYMFNALVLVILAVWLIFLLVKEKAWAPMIGLITGLVLVNSWFVPLSLEYTWTYLLMFVMSIFSWKLAATGKYKILGPCFLIIGMLTSFMDFLTTETLTLLVPLILLVWQTLNIDRKCCIHQIIKNVVKWTVLWGFGYVGMWLMKWCIATIVLRENVLSYVTEHVVERTAGDIGHGWISAVVETIKRNVACLFPLEYGNIGNFVGVVLFLSVIYVGYVYHKPQIPRKQILLYVIIGLVPFVRYIVLLNHSYLHPFFTYRAQLATILAGVMIFVEVVEWRWLIGADDRKTKS